MCTCHSACVRVRDQPSWVVLSFHHVGLNSGGQPWQQAWWSKTQHFWNTVMEEDLKEGTILFPSGTPFLLDYKLTIIRSVSIHVPQSSGHSDFNQNQVATHPENMWKKSGCPIIYQGTNSVAELPNIFLGEEIMLHKNQFLEEITILKMKHFFLNLLSSRYCRSWGPGEAKSSSSVCYSAKPPNHRPS